jgi:hypothetical protein
MFDWDVEHIRFDRLRRSGVFVTLRRPVVGEREGAAWFPWRSGTSASAAGYSPYICIYQRDPVFISGQALGLIVYARNLYLIFAERSAAGREDGGEPPATK